MLKKAEKSAFFVYSASKYQQLEQQGIKNMTSKEDLYAKINHSLQALNNFKKIDKVLATIDKDSQSNEIIVLHKICTLSFTIEHKDSPYIDFTGNTIIEIAQKNLDFLIECVAKLENPILIARISDILWLTKNATKIEKPIQYAQKSIENFSKITLSSENYLDVLECYRRALILHTQTKQTIDTNYIISQLNNAINSTCKIDTPFYQYNSAEILITYNLINDFNQLTNTLITIGENRYSQVGITFGTIEYLELALKVFIKTKNKEEEISLLKKITNIYIEYADRQHQGLHARLFYEKALETARKIPTNQRDDNTTQAINDLETKIYNIGNTIINQMHVISSGQIDITHYQEVAMLNMSNIENTQDALRKFSQLNASLKYANIKNQCIQKHKNSFIQAVCTILPIAHDGRSIGALPKFNESNMEVLEMYMVGYLNQYLPVLNQAYIIPSLQQLYADHKVTLEDIKEICQLSSIVPNDRAELITKALYFGFQEDFQTAIYLLSPQVENIIRQILKANNINTTHIDKDNNQTENGLSSLLDLPKIKYILNEDILFTLKALFTSQLGPNLRNNIAHGLFNDQESYSQEVIYAWWFIFQWIMNTQKSN